MASGAGMAFVIQIIRGYHIPFLDKIMDFIKLCSFDSILVQWASFTQGLIHFKEAHSHCPLPAK